MARIWQVRLFADKWKQWRHAVAMLAYLGLMATICLPLLIAELVQKWEWYTVRMYRIVDAIDKWAFRDPP